MVKEKISEFIDRIRSINGVAACAPVSRDGIISGKSSARELNDPWFCAPPATIPASAESAAGIIRSRPLQPITVQATCNSVIIAGDGEDSLTAVIVRDTADPATNHAEV